MKILLALYPLEVHSRGVRAVARLLQQAGHEVLYIGNATPAAIAQAARDEDVTAIGISAYCGGEVAQTTELLSALGVARATKKPAIMVGGLLRVDSCYAMEHVMGVKCFPSGCDPNEITRWIDNLANPVV